jgi:hypothetical protein
LFLDGPKIATPYDEQRTLLEEFMSDEIKPNAENAALSNDDLGDVTGGTAAPRTLAAAAGATASSKGGTNPLHSAAVTPVSEPSTELPEAELDNVAGGKGQIQDLHVTKKVDQSSPNLF